MIGTRLGPYEILEEIGKGGMATVFRAYQPSIGRYVAIKVIHRAIATDDRAVERFQREARLIARLEHPHLLPVYDYDGAHEPPYIVMRYLEGGTLKDVVDKGALPVVDTSYLLRQISSALDYAHRQSVIHRDIKPSNIMIRVLPNGMQRAIIFDLGLSRFNPIVPLEPDDNSSSDVTATASRVAIGTPAYMAPEQILDARRATEASDIYAAGVVLYLAVSGRHPFVGDERTIANNKLMTEAMPVDLGRLDELGMRFTDVISKAIRRRPEERFTKAGELLLALDDLRMLAASLTAEGSSISVAPGEFLPPDHSPQLMRARQRAEEEADRRARRAYLVALVAGTMAVAIVAFTYFLRG